MKHKMDVVRTLPITSARDAAYQSGRQTEISDGYPFSQLINLVRRRAGLIILTGLLGAALAYGTALHRQKYAAKALILVEPLHGASSNQTATGEPSIDEQTIIETHVMALLSDASLNAILAGLGPTGIVETDRLDLVRLERSLTVQQELHSRVISVVATARSAAAAASIANHAADLYVAKERNRERDKVEQLLLRMHARVETLQKAVDAAPGVNQTKTGAAEVADLPRRLQEDMILESALQRQKDIIDRDDISSSGISLLSPASVPAQPSTGTPWVLAIPAFIAFCILGFFVALTLERSDRSLRSEQDLEDALAIPCFGLVPSVRRPKDLRDIGKRFGSPGDPFWTAIQAVLLEHVLDVSGSPRIVLVTSSVAKEGKSLLALSLAAGAARLNRKVLLIDLDWRSARRKGFAGIPAIVGILDMIGHDADSGIRPVPGLDFDRLGIGRLPGNPLATITNEKIRDLLARFSEVYDTIILDGPNMLDAPEAAWLASLADKVVLAVQWGKTRRDFALNALRNQGDLPRYPRPYAAGRIGAVLTRAKLKRHALYRFGDRGEILSRL
jgi:Mrp family chromosome partitioning ATPase